MQHVSKAVRHSADRKEFFGYNLSEAQQPGNAFVSREPRMSLRDAVQGMAGVRESANE